MGTLHAGLLNGCEPESMMVAEVLSCVQQPKTSPDAEALSGNIDRLTFP